MITSLVVVFVTISIISFLLVGKPDQEQAYAQTQVTNFTQLFSTSKEFQRCLEYVSDQCFPTVDVIYEDPTLLVLASSYIDAIWKGVALAQKERYQIDAMTSYAVGRISGGGSDVNLLVAMSK